VAVVADVAVADPAVFDAVTATRIVRPTSRRVSLYVDAVALPIALQMRYELQRSQRKVNFIGPAPAQVRTAAVSVDPCWVVPAIVGSAMFVGGALGGAGADASAGAGGTGEPGSLISTVAPVAETLMVLMEMSYAPSVNV
jgi:hypothetical protein